MINKQVKGAPDLMHLIQNNMTIMAGGFGICGIPENMINAIAESDKTGFTVISNNVGIDGYGLGKWSDKHKIQKMIGSYVGENKLYMDLLLQGKVDLEFVPQGTLAERVRAGGAGIPAFYVATGYGTEIAEGKEVKEFDGRKYIMEKALKADIALVKAWKGDATGNLVFKATANNFNQSMAMAGKITIAEVEEMVPVGSLDPNHIHVPGIFVQHIFQGVNYEKRIERLTTANQI